MKHLVTGKHYQAQLVDICPTLFCTGTVCNLHRASPPECFRVESGFVCQPFPSILLYLTFNLYYSVCVNFNLNAFEFHLGGYL